MVPEGTEEEILERVAKKAGDYEEVSISCSQGTLAALQEEFNLAGGRDVIKAATFMPGIASRKETCGDIRPAIMGRDYNSMDPKDRQQFLDDDGPKKCRVPPEKAARIAASILLEK